MWISENLDQMKEMAVSERVLSEYIDMFSKVRNKRRVMLPVRTMLQSSALSSF